ncbi:MAG: hypothetical protein DWQ07_12685 [Chloroflexi bacterium]|nr:MAG: hypothetical protein DWQ07_12685 [Chloroflexota bacterium]MBL1196894.1 hypothetical protein [Chloroflexota bacterium]NOH14190.1 hypothetical protein [Chloroflexota bacterium]
MLYVPLHPLNWRTWLRVGLVLLITLMIVTTVSAAPVAQEATPADFLQLVLDWATDVAPNIAWLLVLILADFILGVAVALKTRMFDWSKLADFYGSNVLPKVLGYVVIHALLYVSQLLPTGIVPDGWIPVTDVAAFAVIVAGLVGSIGGHFIALGFSNTESFLGVRNTINE